MRFECTLLRPSHFTWNETGWGFRLIFLQCQCGSIFAGWDPPRVIKHHYSSFTHLGNSLRIQHQLNRVSLILGGFPHGWVGRNENCPSPWAHHFPPLGSNSFLQLSRTTLRQASLVAATASPGEAKKTRGWSGTMLPRQAKCTLRSTT